MRDLQAGLARAQAEKHNNNKNGQLEGVEQLASAAATAAVAQVDTFLQQAALRDKNMAEATEAIARAAKEIARLKTPQIVSALAESLSDVRTRQASSGAIKAPPSLPRRPRILRRSRKKPKALR